MFDLKGILSIDLVGDICDRREIWTVVRLPCQGIVLRRSRILESSGCARVRNTGTDYGV